MSWKMELRSKLGLGNLEVQKEGWDFCVESPRGIRLLNGEVVHRIYVKATEKPPTMQYLPTVQIYIKMQEQLLNDDDCVCVLLELQETGRKDCKWSVTVCGTKVKHPKLRRMSMACLEEVLVQK